MDNRTPRATIRGNLRRMFVVSKERAQAMKNTQYCCNRCGVKQSKAKGQEQKIEVHHKQGIDNWDKVIDAIQEFLLCDPIHLEPLCPDCHDKITYDDK